MIAGGQPCTGPLLACLGCRVSVQPPHPARLPAQHVAAGPHAPESRAPRGAFVQQQQHCLRVCNRRHTIPHSCTSLGTDKSWMPCNARIRTAASRRWRRHRPWWSLWTAAIRRCVAHARQQRRGYSPHPPQTSVAVMRLAVRFMLRRDRDVSDIKDAVLDDLRLGAISDAEPEMCVVLGQRALARSPRR